MTNRNVAIIAILIFATQMVLGYSGFFDSPEEIEMDQTSAGVFAYE